MEWILVVAFFYGMSVWLAYWYERHAYFDLASLCGNPDPEKTSVWAAKQLMWYGPISIFYYVFINKKD